MKKALILVLMTFAGIAHAEFVSGYTKADGTVVDSYCRRASCASATPGLGRAVGALAAIAVGIEVVKYVRAKQDESVLLESSGDEVVPLPRTDVKFTNDQISQIKLTNDPAILDSEWLGERFIYKGVIFKWAGRTGGTNDRPRFAYRAQ